jgi:hypothetical protein
MMHVSESVKRDVGAPDDEEALMLNDGFMPLGGGEPPFGDAPYRFRTEIRPGGRWERH